MYIQCTQKMLKFLCPKIIRQQRDDDIYAWHANYITIFKKKFFVFMHDRTRFCVVLYGLKKADFNDPILMFKKAILIAMTVESYDQSLILNYVNGFDNITYGPTKNRKLISQLNRAVIDASWYAYEHLYNQIFQPEISEMLNRSPVGTNH